MKKLFVFGDSWPYGSELRDGEKSFGELLASRSRVPWHNFAQGSTSIPHLILQLRRAKEYCDVSEHNWQLSGTTALFFLTSPNRDLIWRESREKELHVSSIYHTDPDPLRSVHHERQIHLNPSHKTDWDVKWYTEWHTAELATYRVNTTLMALHHMCRNYGIDDRYVWGWNRVELWPEVDSGRFWRFGASTVLDLFDDLGPPQSLTDYVNRRPNQYIWPNGGHPNQAGHRRIADALHGWLDPTFRSV